MWLESKGECGVGNCRLAIHIWVFRNRRGEIPAAVQSLSHLNPNFFCKIINLHKLSDSVLRRAESTGVVIEAIRRFWRATEEDVALLLRKAREIPAVHRGIVMIPLTDYYEYTDGGFGRGEFDRIEREYWPGLREEERLMPTIEFSLDKAERRGIEQGIERKQRDVVARMLAKGMPDEQICDVIQLSGEELADIKRTLNCS